MPEKQTTELAGCATSERERLRRPKRENSYAKRYAISAMASTGHDRPSRRSLSVCPRRGRRA